LLTISGFRLRSVVQSALCHIREIRDFAAMHPTRLLRQRATASAADFVTARMPDALSFYTAREVLGHCLARLQGDGQILEFGVFRGGTIDYMARTCPRREVHGFDTFEGLPAGWSGTGYEAGAFSAQGRLPRVPRNVTLHKGLFDATLPAWLAANDRPISLIHIDSDLYSSAATVLGLLRHRIEPGTIIVFDEYFGYPGWEHGEHRAFVEFIRDTSQSFEYLCHARQQVAVRITPRRDGSMSSPGE
jgi:predicted O-methyltransferase YrrM